jgi:hypothetical protein
MTKRLRSYPDLDLHETKKQRVGDYDDRECPEKKEINECYIMFNQKYLKNTVSNPIIFDGVEMRTTKAMKDSGLKINGSIHIPEINEKTHEIHKEQNQMGVKPYDGSLNKFINSNKKIIKDSNSVFFDYTGCITGNYKKKYFPLQDISDSLKQTKQEKIVLEITSCLRGLTETADEILDSYLKPCFEWHQYKIIDKKIKKYKRSGKSKSVLMSSFVIALEKDKSIDVKDIHFMRTKKPINGKYCFRGYDPEIPENQIEKLEEIR